MFREETLRRYFTCSLEQVVVRVARVVVHAGFQLEDGNREDSRLSVAEAVHDGVERLLDDEAAGRTRAEAVVDTGKGHLCQILSPRLFIQGFWRFLSYEHALLVLDTVSRF